MKTKTSILALTAAVVFLCSAVHGEEGSLSEGMGKKFFRGGVNVLTGWVELPMQTIKGYKRGIHSDENNKVLGTLGGFFRGIGHSLGRTVWGVVELLGFWAANPEGDTSIGIPLDAEYAWEDGDPYNCFDPNFTEAALEPMGRKLIRGAGNAIFGFAELPGQIAKGFREEAPGAGIIKGLWYWASRELYGAGEVVTSIVPTPQDSPGRVFDQEYPWDALVDVIEK